MKYVNVQASHPYAFTLYAMRKELTTSMIKADGSVCHFYCHTLSYLLDSVT